jgi:hypothetical protein
MTDPNGYIRHTLAGVLIGFFSAWFLLLMGEMFAVRITPLAAALLGLLAAASAGLLKEVRDKATGKGVADWKDSACTIVGGFGSFAVLLKG